MTSTSFPCLSWVLILNRKSVLVTSCAVKSLFLIQADVGVSLPTGGSPGFSYLSAGGSVLCTLPPAAALS